MDITKDIKSMLESEGLKAEDIKINPSIYHNDSMHREDENGKVWQLNGTIGEITLSDGRKGLIVISLDFRST